MNLSEIRGQVRGHLNEATAAFWTDTELNSWINSAVRKIHNRIKSVSRVHFTTRATFPTVSGQEYYKLPADCKDVRMLTRITSEGEEIPLNRAQQDTLFERTDVSSFQTSNIVDGSDGPDNYWMIGASIRLVPKLGSVITMRLYYEARLVDLVAQTDAPAFDADYHDMAAKWAAVEALTKDGRNSSDILALYDRRDKDLIEDVLHRCPSPALDTIGFLEGIW